MTSEYLDTPIGLLEITGDDSHIYAVQFVEEKKEANTYTFLPRELAKGLEQLEAYFEGSLSSFALQLAERGTAFQRRVWLHTSQIPKGQIKTYKQVQQELTEGAPRAIGQALGKNPFLIVVPCHRVLASTGDLTGYAGGKDRKSWLLSFENAYQAPKQLSLF